MVVSPMRLTDRSHADAKGNKAQCPCRVVRCSAPARSRILEELQR